ncbi:MAG TPA: response regulator [Polyangia bacterium]|nr:response regulator [Polyangia bacterium]
MKAVAMAAAQAAMLASGDTTEVLRSSRTSYRGEMAIVSLERPESAIAVGELVSVRPVVAVHDTRDRERERQYAWEFRNVSAISKVFVRARPGVFSIRVPVSAPSVETGPTLASTGKRGPWIKVQVASDLRSARAGLRRVSEGLDQLVPARRPSPAQLDYQRIKAILGGLQMGVDQLIETMTLSDSIWKRQLTSWTDNQPVVPSRADGKVPSLRLDILVVDDEPKTARGLQRSLGRDHTVRVAVSKQEALDQIRQKVPDVLLCDYRIEWESAEDLLQFVRETHPAVRRILYSFSRIEVWVDLLNRKLIDTAVPKSAPRSQILAALA